MSFVNFLVSNARWVGGGFLLMFFSCFGQTYFIGLSAGDIRAEYGLSNGQFGTLYMVATLASAMTLPHIGRVVDHFRVTTVLLGTAPMLALACVSMALSHSVAVLVVTIYLLRLFGQGMMTHISQTAMGKWFSAQRGRAVSVSAIGVNFSEALFPISFVAVTAAIGWRNSWLAAAGLLVFFALPVIYFLMRVEREPQNPSDGSSGPVVRQWTRGEVLRDPYFYLLLTGVLAPPFIGTTIFFHQVYLVELRDWSQGAFAASFVVSSSMTVLFSLVCGYLIDRFSALRILPAFLLPLAAACICLSLIEAQYGVFIFMALLGVSYGFSSTLFGALWPEVYGTAHLGAVRSIIVAAMVFMTAMGPGLTGTLIDLGVPYPAQIMAFGIYCVIGSGLLWLGSRRIMARDALGVPETAGGLQ